MTKKVQHTVRCLRTSREGRQCGRRTYEGKDHCPEHMLEGVSRPAQIARAIELRVEEVLHVHQTKRVPHPSLLLLDAQAILLDQEGFSVAQLAVLLDPELQPLERLLAGAPDEDGVTYSQMKQRVCKAYCNALVREELAVWVRDGKQERVQLAGHIKSLKHAAAS